MCVEEVRIIMGKIGMVVSIKEPIEIIVRVIIMTVVVTMPMWPIMMSKVVLFFSLEGLQSY